MRKLFLTFVSLSVFANMVNAQASTFVFEGDVIIRNQMGADFYGVDSLVTTYRGVLVFDTSQTVVDGFTIEEAPNIRTNYNYDSFVLEIGIKTFSFTQIAEQSVLDRISIDDAKTSAELDGIALRFISDGLIGGRPEPDGVPRGNGSIFVDNPFGAPNLFDGTDARNIESLVGFGSGTGSFNAIGAGGSVSFRNSRITSVTYAVPEPATWLMMIIGFAGVGLMAKRRRRTLKA